LAPRKQPLRTGRCRVRALRCSFTIATFSRENPPGERLSRFSPREFDGTAPRRALAERRSDDAPAVRAFARFGDNYRRMNELSKDAVSWLTVDDEAAGQRIDNFLVRVLKGVPKSHVYRILRSGEVRVNKGRVGPDVRLAPGDVIRVPPVRTARPAATAAHEPVVRAFKPAILLEDDWLIAVDKPAGLAVHGGSGIAQGLIEQLRASRPKARLLELVHRLDRETSGVLLVAKKRTALTELHAQLRDGEIDKRYVALVRGPWPASKRVVDVPLHKFATAEGERRVRADAEGRESVTIFRREKAWPDHDPPLALLEAELKTGRTHQIRVHLAHIGHALAGDDKYGDFAWNRTLAHAGLKRMFLHSRQLRFRHPASGEPTLIASPLPDALARFLARLSATAR
jgi:23S rRNA pseudouridine955/2504/2580 synthase